jgi:hypothetical protein
LTASISVALTLRKMTAGLTKGATGAKLMCLNGAIGAISASCAAYINTQMMRQAEIKNGIKVMNSSEMSDKDIVGFSSVCGAQAVKETAMSRVALATLCYTAPPLMYLGLTQFRHVRRAIRRSPVAKLGLELGTISATLILGLPLTIGIFDPVCKIEGK